MYKMERSLPTIKNIVFDLGKVLLNLNFDATIDAFRNLGLGTEVVTPLQTYIDPVFYEFEVGIISPENFRNRVRQILNNPDATDQQIDDAWCAMLLDVPGYRVDLLKALKNKYDLYLFSNTNILHIRQFHQKFLKTYRIEFPSLFRKVFYSHELKKRKPDLEAFHQVLELSGIHSEETLFIDDLEKNIEGASLAGMQTVWLRNGMDITEIFTNNF